MRRILLVALMLLTAAGAGAQTDTYTRGDTTIVERIPAFQDGGVAKFRQWVAARVKYPEMAWDMGLTGAVRVSFIVGMDGSVGDVEVVESSSPLFSNEVTSIVRSSPKWTPGHVGMFLKDGTVIEDEDVRVKYSIDITFTLPGVETAPLPRPGFTGPIHENPEREPEFMGGGVEKFAEWVAANINPKMKKKAKGAAGIMFVVEPDGSVSNVQMLLVPDKKTAEEVMRVVPGSPRWRPGFQDGKPVRTSRIIRIDFDSQ